MDQLLTWAVLVAGALIIGISKTSVGGFGSLAVAGFALVMPTKESTATILLLLIVGDIVALTRFRRDCDWGLLVRLLPWVLPGLFLGAWFLNSVDDLVLRRSIGAILAVCVALQLWQRWRAKRRARHKVEAEDEEPLPQQGKLGRWVAGGTAGIAAGFTTMAANAAGPVMALYLLAAGVSKAAFVGTGAWYFLIVNVTKVPFSAALGLYSADNLIIVAILVPVVLLGTIIGIRITGKVSQATFEWLALSAAIIAPLALLLL
ncbi:sulfite exporter TauE/SafE family protein [Parenemella sanctibonifatiensis]|uniref:Probable membrane transporter protein n=1 Tax=Parenemella sanctibonifatiensis TaxID=2016505 RepID=A0A255ERA3_9ACTN|nr:sulfite exporter TauE/SafE family protein [Parenemella sanctibonifatiensis]OYN87821.1 hypothetical protein CGZ92_06020 [Parenemella sanctibonifatiensis]OYN92125.1 hypothetical protein CGZ91_00995 [Parenemella sanctibonifatiensis]